MGLLSPRIISEVDLVNAFTREVEQLALRHTASDRAEILMPRPGSFQPHPGVRLTHWFPSTATEVARAAGITGPPKECVGVPTPHGLSRTGFVPLGERKPKRLVLVLLQGNCSIKITQPIKKNLYLPLNDTWCYDNNNKTSFALHYRSRCILFPCPQRAMASRQGDY